MTELIEDEAGDDKGALEEAGHRHIGDASVDDDACVDDDLTGASIVGFGYARQVAGKEVGELLFAANHDDNADQPE